MDAIRSPQCVFLSPHLDDAVLSCGGMIYQLAQAGRAVQVITIFAGDPPPGLLSPFAQSLHDRWQDGSVARRGEDIQALTLLGAEAIRARAGAILAYRSQISTFFKSVSEMEQRVHAYAALVGGETGPAERLWRAG